MTKDEGLRLALEGAANYIDVLGGDSKKYRQLLAQPAPVQEPVAWVEKNGDVVWQNYKAAIGRNLYTTPPAAVVNQQLTTEPATPLQEPPPECQTEAEKRAYAFGWWKALEANRATLVQDQIRAITQEAMQKIYDLEDQVRRKVYNTPAAGEKK
jgi:hypothetical protein